MAATILAHVRGVANTIEHGTASVVEDISHTANHNHLAVEEVRVDEIPQRVGQGCGKGNEDHSDDCGQVIGRSLEVGVDTAGSVTDNPITDGFGRRLSIYSVREVMTRKGVWEVANPELKSKRRGSNSVTANSPTVGWKKSRTGAVCRPSCRW